MGPIRVAIVGGGLGGCTLANGLLKHSNVTFDVFESGPAFSERGAQISLAINAQNALREMGFDVDAMIKSSGAVLESSVRVIFGEGEYKGAYSFDMAGTFSVHRVQWLDELLKPLPKDRLHVNKKLLRMEANSGTLGDGPITLHFRDGTTHTADAIVGCDGIHSAVRRCVLGEDHAAVNPVSAGFWDCRNVVPIKKAREKLGTELFDPGEPVQIAGAGEGVFYFSSPIIDGEAIGIAAAGVTEPGLVGDKWRAPLSQDFLLGKFHNWGKFGAGLVDCLMEQEKPELFFEWESAEAPTYCNGSVCMMGDAAHASTPWQGSGAGIALEDAMVLQAVLGAASDPKDVPAAFKAFDQLRRERTQRVVTSSRGTGLLFCGQGVQGGLSPQTLKADMLPRWKFIWELDMNQHVREAIAAFTVFKHGSG